MTTEPRIKGSHRRLSERREQKRRADGGWRIAPNGRREIERRNTSRRLQSTQAEL